MGAFSTVCVAFQRLRGAHGVSAGPRHPPSMGSFRLPRRCCVLRRAPKGLKKQEGGPGGPPSLQTRQAEKSLSLPIAPFTCVRQTGSKVLSVCGCPPKEPCARGCSGSLNVRQVEVFSRVLRVASLSLGVNHSFFIQCVANEACHVLDAVLFGVVVRDDPDLDGQGDLPPRFFGLGAQERNRTIMTESPRRNQGGGSRWLARPHRVGARVPLAQDAALMGVKLGHPENFHGETHPRVRRPGAALFRTTVFSRTPRRTPQQGPPPTRAP